jgi:hypothetical protein
VTHTSIFACDDPRGLHWQLGPLPPVTGRLTLVGWSQTTSRHDAGVPEEVARVLARALTSIARVTFPSSAADGATRLWSPSGDDLVRALTGQGFGDRVVAKLRGRPPDVALMSTRRPETAMRLFDDASFPWWMQGQVVLLSDPDAPPPDLDEDALLALFGEDWTKHAALLAANGVRGIMRPGVDGDVAGLLSSRDEFEQVVLDALERETRLAGFDWALLPESAFAEVNPNP